MSKFTVGLTAALLLAAVPLFATGEDEAAAADMAPGAILPWAGAEVVYNGFGADLGIQEDPEAPVVQAYRETTGNVRIEWDTVPWNDYDTKLNLYLQSGDMPDIVWARESVPKAATYGPVGIFLDWDAVQGVHAQHAALGRRVPARQQRADRQGRALRHQRHHHRRVHRRGLLLQRQHPGAGRDRRPAGDDGRVAGADEADQGRAAGRRRVPHAIGDWATSCRRSGGR